MDTNYGARPGLTMERLHILVRLGVNNATGGCGWLAAFERGYGPDAETVRLFGTHIIPTPFSAKATSADVLAQLRKLNPDAVVVLS